MRLAIPPPHQCVIYISWYSKHHPKTLDMSYTLAQILLLCQSGFTGFEFLCEFLTATNSSHIDAHKGSHLKN